MEEETQKTVQEIEVEISRSMRARVKDFKDQADSLTLEGVRRALEKDLCMETFSLDVHKRFIKQCLEECFYGGDDVNLSTTTVSASDQHTLHLNKEASDGKEERRQPKDISSSVINETAEESPAEERMPNHEPMKSVDFEHDSKLAEDIKEAIRKQGPYFRANLEKITMAKVRRLLEQDLNLEKNALDAYKSFIRDELDEVLQASETCETTNGTKKKPKKASNTKETVKTKVKRATKTVTDDSGSSNLDNDTSEADEDIVVVKRSKKRPLQKAKTSMKLIKQQKTSSDQNMPSSSRKKKREESDVEQGSESDDGKSSGDGRAPSSSDERSKKHEKPTAPAHGKNVENLKLIIKACGMGVPPAVYKRAKQAPESKREAYLIKELEEILAKEGLSSNPSDKEIKAVKKKKERARELEGIDTSNIVSSSRRRSTFNFIHTPKPKIEAESDEDEDDEDEEDEEDEVAEDGADDGDNGNEESSEGLEEDANEDSD